MWQLQCYGVHGYRSSGLGIFGGDGIVEVDIEEVIVVSSSGL